MLESRYNHWVHFDAAHYVFNAATGALRRVSAADHAALERFLATRGREVCPLPLLLSLCRDGMLVAEEADEVEALRRRYAQARLDRSQLDLIVVTSLGCNFACPYCYEARHPSLMSQAVQTRLLCHLDERLPELKSLDVRWFGGEPLLGQEALFGLSTAFQARCRAAGVQYTAQITTNGYLLDEATCQRLADHGVTRAQITLDGPPEVHDRMRPLAGGQGTFWQIMKNLRHAVNYFQVTVKTNLDRDSYERAVALLDILAGQGLAGKLAVGADRIRWDQAAAPGSGSRDGRGFGRCEFVPLRLGFKALAVRAGFAAWSLPAPTALSCSVLTGNSLTVGSEGELYPCPEQVGVRDEILGDLEAPARRGSAEIFAGFDPFGDAECRACPVLPLCMGGCPHDALSRDPATRADRCSELLYSYQEEIKRYVETQETASAAAVPEIA